MGFRYKQFVYIGNTGSWGDGSTPQSRSLVVFKDIVNWLVNDSNTGWILDSNRNQTVDDYTDIPFWQSLSRSELPEAYQGAGLFLKNTISKCRMFIGAQHYRQTYSSDISPKIPQVELEGIIGSDSGGYSSNIHTNCIGIMMSIVPPHNGDFGEDFGRVFDGETQFIPATATRLMSTNIKQMDLSYRPMSEYNASGWAFAYRLFATPYVIGVSGRRSDTGPIEAYPTIYGGSYFCGKIFGSLAHEETSDSANYGVITFGTAPEIGEGREFDYDPAWFAINTYIVNSGSKAYIVSSALPSAEVTPYGSRYSSCGFFAANGRPIRGVRAVTNLRFWPSSTYDLNTNLSNIAITGQLRWTPIAVGVVSTDLATYGVVPGDGFKGYLDTNLFRIGYPVTIGKLYDSGNFIGFNDCLVLGWDPSNEL